MHFMTEIISSSKHDILIVMDDLNAKVGNENTGLESHGKTLMWMYEQQRTKAG